MKNTKEKVVWITGASSGISKAMAFEWVRLGYKVVLSARRKELLEKIALEIKNSGGEALVVPVDIMEEKSIFEMILNKEIDSEIIYEDDEIFAIHDINPVAPIHVLIIPKKKIKTINDVTQEDEALIGKLVITAKNLAKSLGIDESGYRLLWNTNKDAMQTVFHIHLHLIGGTMLKAI